MENVIVLSGIVAIALIVFSLASQLTHVPDGNAWMSILGIGIIFMVIVYAIIVVEKVRHR